MKTIFQSENGEVWHDGGFNSSDKTLFIFDMAKEIKRLRAEIEALQNERDELLEAIRYR